MVNKRRKLTKLLALTLSAATILGTPVTVSAGEATVSAGNAAVSAGKEAESASEVAGEQDRVRVTTMELKTITTSRKDAADISANEAAIYKYLTGELKLNKAAASAVLANIFVECSYSPTAYNSYENAWGLCQWRSGRLANLKKAYPSTWKTMESQLAFIKDEFGGKDYSGPQTFSYLKNLPNTKKGARDGALYFAKYFERCAASTYLKRQDKAEELYGKKISGCPAPTIKKAVWTEEDTLNVSWIKPSEAEKTRLQLLDESGKVVASAESTVDTYTFTNLTAPAVSVRMWCVNKEKKTSLKVIEKVKLKTPSLTSISCKTKGLQVRWEAVPEAESYYVYRKLTGDTSWTKIATVSEIFYTDQDVEHGKEYSYTVRAAAGSVSSGRKSLGLSDVYVKTPVMNALQKEKKGVSVTWKSVADATSYIIYRKSGSQGWTRIGTVEAGRKLKFVDSKVKKGTKYTYSIRTVRGTEYSGYGYKGKTISY